MSLDGLEVGGGLAGVELAEGGEDGAAGGCSAGRVERTTRCGSAEPNWGAAAERYICQPDLASALVSRTSAMTPMTRASVPPIDGDAVDGIFVGPEVAGDGFVDDDDGLFGVDVFPGHVAALDEAHADGVEVAGGDDVDEGAGELVGLVVLALGGDSPGAVAGHGERVGDGGGLDAGDLLDAVDDLAVEGGVRWLRCSTRLLRRRGCMAEAREGSKPRSTSRTRRKLRRSRPAPTRRTQARAIWETTRVVRRRGGCLASGGAGG